MAKSNKFGTFGGVYTPSVLTILGVIMYLRLPWVVGNVGLYATLGIILVAHIISISTGLSISSIATDKKVGAGGPYYIVSRSLGLPIGGTLGLALFVGLSFSISLYVIGFCESFLSFWGMEPTPNTIRVAGSIVLVLLTLVTVISTEFAIKTQYIVFGLIALSLVSIGAGRLVIPAAPAIAASPEGASIAVAFGIFFPAVTGFTAGVNMSGDLKDPKKAIPRGTLSAILTGLIVYVGLAIFLAYRVPRERLIGESDVLSQIAFSSPAVIAGIWGATLSSALGSILGAPRILQAMSSDGITPRIFARGHGPGNDPRNALVLAFMIAEAGILIAELNMIARVVSMVFLTTYSFLNLSGALESWASPDFRPSFRVPKSISVIGAVTCMVVMIQLDLAAMLGAATLMIAVLLYLQRRQLVLVSGDAWEGIWQSLVRTGLYRLTQMTQARRNWRPNILLFREVGRDVSTLSRLGTSLVSGSGILTDIELVDKKAHGKTPGSTPIDDQLGVFSRTLETDDRFDTVGHLARYHGFAAVAPNTVLLDRASFAGEPGKLSTLTRSLAELDLNVLLYALAPPTAEVGAAEPRIDVWWSDAAGNLTLSLALLRFVTSHEHWREAKVRFLLASTDSADNETLRAAAQRQLSAARFDASIRVLNTDFDTRRIETVIADESRDAALTLLGLPTHLDEVDEAYEERIEALLGGLQEVLLIRASSAFSENLYGGREAAISYLPPQMSEGGGIELPDVSVPDTPVLAAAAGAFHEQIGQRATAFHELCVARILGDYVRLARAVKGLYERHFSMLEKGLEGANPTKQQKVINRVQSSFLMEARTLLEEFESGKLEDQRSVLDGQIQAFIEDCDDALIHGRNPPVLVERQADDFASKKDDSGWLRRFKRRRRWFSKTKQGTIRYRSPLGQLETYFSESTLSSLLETSVRRLMRDSHSLVVQLGKLLNGSTTTLALLSERYDTPEALSAFVSTQRDQALRNLEELVTRGRERIGAQQWALVVEVRKLADAFGKDIDRVDALHLVKKERKLPRDRMALRVSLSEASAGWQQQQAALFGRAKLALDLSQFHHRLAAIVHRKRQSVTLEISNGALDECRTAEETLRKLARAKGNKYPSTLELSVDSRAQLDPKEVLDGLTHDVREAVAELPETVETLTDDSIRALEEGESDQLEMAEVPLRRMVEFVVDAELIGGLEQELARVAPLERRALDVAQNVLRLVSFQLSQLDALGGTPDKEMTAHLNQVLENGIERLSAETIHLGELPPSIAHSIERRLGLVIDGISAFDLSNRAGQLHQDIRMHQGRQAVSGARRLLRRGYGAIRGGLVRLLYRRSAGVLLAKKLQSDSAPQKLVDRVHELVEECSPNSAVVDDLPFYYRQLFSGQSAVNDTFWVGRKKELGRARAAIASFRAGSPGIVLVSGERGSGKSALCQRISGHLLGKKPVCRVHAPAGGSLDFDDFEAALGRAVGHVGDADQLLAGLSDGTTVVLDDIELWWERSDLGFAMLDRILELIDRHCHRALFLVAIGTQALEFIDRFRHISDRALGAIECAPMPTEELAQIVLLRHRSTGLQFQIDDKEEAFVSELELARLFSAHFDFSQGNVAAALRSWVTHVDRTQDEVLILRRPDTPHFERLEGLRVEWLALLLQLTLHKRLTRDAVSRLAGAEAASDTNTIDRDIETMARMGLIVRTHNDVLDLNPFVAHVVSDRLHAWRLLK